MKYQVEVIVPVTVEAEDMVQAISKAQDWTRSEFQEALQHAFVDDDGVSEIDEDGNTI